MLNHSPDFSASREMAESGIFVLHWQRFNIDTHRCFPDEYAFRW